MAYVEQVTKIANPATGRRKRRTVARRMTLKQKLHFGSSRQRAAAKASLSEKRHSKAKRRNAAPRRRVNRPRTQAVARRHRTRRNVGEVVYMLGANPAKRRNSSMTKTKRRGSRKNRATRRNTHRRNPVMVTSRRHMRRNAGGVNVTEYLKLGAAVVGGAVGSKALTQVVLSSSNTGVMGYFGNLVATIALGYGAKMAFRDEKVAQGVVGGGIAQIIVRALNDYTPYGSVLANSGVGDYQLNWNFTNPQRVAPGYPPRYLAQANIGSWPSQTNLPVPVAMPVVTHAAPASGMGYASGKTLNRWN